MANMFGNGQLPDILNSAMAGARVPYDMEEADLNLASSRTKNLGDAEKLRMMIESENPLKEAENKNKLAIAGEEGNPDFIRAMTDAKIAEAQGKGLKYDEEKRAAQRTFIKEFGDELNAKIKRGQNPYDPMNATSKADWDSRVAEAKKLGIPGFPEVPDTQPDGSSKAIQSILTKAASLGQESSDFTSKKALAEAPGLIQERIHAATDKSNQGIQAGHDASKEEVAQIKADAAAAKQRSNQTVIQAVVADIQSGNTPRPALLNLAAEAAYNSASKDTPMGLRALMIETDNKLSNDEKDAKKEDWKKAWIKQTFSDAGKTAPKAATQAVTSEAPKATGASKYVKGYVDPDFPGWAYKGSGNPKDKANWEKTK